MTDRSNDEWIADLSEPGPRRDAALEDLRALLVRGLGYAMAKYRNVTEADIEDFAQDAILKIVDALETFRGESRFSTWLHSLALNVALAGRRRWWRRDRREILTDDPASLYRVEREPFPDDGIDLERAIAALPAGARSVFVLHDVEGYRHEEIAALCRVTVGTSKAQLHRARRLLKERLAP